MMLGAIVDWGALREVVVYSLIAGIGVPAVYALSVAGAARSLDARRERRGTAATVYGVAALVGTAFCLFAIGYGIYLMTQK